MPLRLAAFALLAAILPAAASAHPARSSSPSVSIVTVPRSGTATTASVRFALRNATVATCRLDRGRDVPCASPARYAGLRVGHHTVTVTAVAGSARASASGGWTVRPRRQTTQRPASTSQTTASTGSTAIARGAATTLAPAPYAVPGDATLVSSASQLQSELAKPDAHDIVLADGDYSASSSFSNANGDHVYAAHLGGAVLHAGMTLGGNWGPGGGLVQGVTFDVTDPSTLEDNAAVDVWGNGGKNSSVLDVTIHGHGVAGYGIRDVEPEGFVAERVTADGFTSDGVSVDSYPDPISFARNPLLEDIAVSNVARPVPRSSDGTSEACIWLGTPVTLTRARLRNCAWMGLWTGFNGVGSTYSDVDVDDTPVGVYIEHFTTSSTFSNLQIGTGVRVGVNCEWADPAWGGRPASTDNVIRDSLIEASWVGVYMDEGTTRTSVVDSTFRGEAGAAIVDYRGISNSYSNNDVSGLAPGGVAVSPDHL